MSDEFRKHQESMIGDLFYYIVTKDSQDGGPEEKKIREVVDVSLFTVTEHQQPGLMDYMQIPQHFELHLRNSKQDDRLLSWKHGGQRTRTRTCSE
ncbi:MAG: hypothetical protein CMJ81_00645 [Planctomycetaceae bacterium]|nr:hypothetical protein [Planctomycetaceae bacterium]MBP63945.1 hypothetical protein [Planctomycetaceae bacterium]